MELGTDVTGPIAAAQQAAVEALLRQRDLPPRQRERLEMVKAAWLGEDVAAIAQWSGRTPRTVRRWLAAFRDGWRGGAGRCAHPGASAQGRRGLSGGAGGGAGHAAPDAWACRSTSGARGASAPIWRSRRACASRRAGCGCSCTGSASPAAGPNTPWRICKTRRKSPPVSRLTGGGGKRWPAAAGALRAAL